MRKALPPDVFPLHQLKFQLVVDALEKKRQQTFTALPSNIRDFASLALLFPQRSGNSRFVELMYDKGIDSHINPQPGNQFGQSTIDRRAYRFTEDSIIWVEADNFEPNKFTEIFELVAQQVKNTGSKVPLIVFVGSAYALR